MCFHTLQRWLFLISNTDTQEQSHSVPSKDNPPHPLPTVQKPKVWNSPSHGGERLCTPVTPPLSPGVPWAAPRNPLQPWIRQDGFTVAMSESPDTHQPSTTPRGLPSHNHQSVLQAQLLVQRWEPTPHPQPQEPVSSWLTAHSLWAKLNLVPLFVSGNKNQQSKVSWVRKLQEKTQTYFTCLSWSKTQ